MSETTETQNTAGLKLNGLFAFKEGMATIYNENGEAVPVTVLRYEPWFVSQIKTNEADGYEAIQVACHPKKAKNSNKAEKGHLEKAGFENGAQFVKELRQAAPEGTVVGAQISIDSLAKGDFVKITSKSKGKGFAGSVKRWGFAGGPASHGSKFHRRPGSSGNRTWPGRVMPGKKFPGHLGAETVTVKNVEVVQIIAEENVLMVKGPVSGARNTLVKLVRE
ncbi:50S ribosomal protein L3 [Bdellovibrio bacteriovorus]|uniref:50S ribosomal protein L3 n=1 Tax=Bdellovibrio bacteriovorus TaxID=959 RepID=UPI00045BE567|nr:50S ribosomal protein L3 [Bdellovibrio bacteriovorus]AHZ83376.1 50S ribosomal protein L3 [Bdellovibrio bacteriovorus]BEV69346.1 50S ribosomal protein L3 [Bdellovibrio bacteriovorus]